MDLVYLSAAQVLILILGGIVVFYALRAHSRTKSRAMLLLGLGFAFVTVGAAIAGVLFNVANVSLPTVESVQAASQAVGFFIIVYSLTRTKD
ncbi:MAG: hypothetical protein ACLQEQ_08875 [Nitrososphaerales archaeon]